MENNTDKINLSASKQSAGVGDESDRTLGRHRRVIAWSKVLSVPDWMLVGLMLVTGAVLSGWTSLMVWQWEREQAEVSFQEKIDDVAHALKTTIASELSVLKELSDFYGASELVEREEFSQFVSRSLSEYPSIGAVVWLPRVPDGQRQDFEAQMSAQGYPNFQITEVNPQGIKVKAQKRDSYFPVTYLQPMMSYQQVIGLDLGSDGTSEALQKARDTGQIITQMHLWEFRETPDELVFGGILPIYRDRTPYASLQMRQQSLQGFVLGVFQLYEILKEAFEGQDSIVVNTTNIAWVHPTFARATDPGSRAKQPLTKYLFAFYDAQTGKLLVDPKTVERENSFLCRQFTACTRKLQFGDREWLIQFLPTPEYMAAQPQSQLWMTPLVGLSMTGFVTACLLILLERKGRMEQLLQERSQSNWELLQLNAQLKQANEEITLLGKMIDLLQACYSREEADTTIHKLVQQLFPEGSGVLYRLNASGNLLEEAISWGDQPTSKLLFPPHDCWALRCSRKHLFQDAKIDLSCPHCSPGRAHESFCLPLMAQRETLGMLYLSSQPGQLTKAKQQLAVTLADHIALAISNLKLRETLKNQSIRDPLTGLFNRRYLEEFLERELLRSQRHQQPLAAIAIDADRFKRFNDTFGHDAGDAVLRALAMCLEKNIRGSDIACRYGGEEFTLILPEASLDDTRKRAEQLRRQVKLLNVQHLGQPLGKITVSMGVACFPEHGLTAEALIRAADEALYRAKKAGRDRVVAASDTLTL
ncbi:MAG: diguanylate cyclase [Hormoscilla sp. GM7CHS1pb]|nr:diguanylate cyclase [Hormoscilla sp. GM7CHS1pb]